MVDTNNFSNDPNGASNSVDLKIAVLGKSLVGKSALTYRFISDKFPTEHDTTIEDQYKINTTIDEYNCKLEILDTAGQDDYQSMLDTWIGFAEGFVLVYSIDDRESFDSLKSKYDKKDQAIVAARIIKNTYKVLMTRGMKGCYVYCTDKALSEYFRKRLSVSDIGKGL